MTDAPDLGPELLVRVVFAEKGALSALAQCDGTRHAVLPPDVHAIARIELYSSARHPIVVALFGLGSFPLFRQALPPAPGPMEPTQREIHWPTQYLHRGPLTVSATMALPDERVPPPQHGDPLDLARAVRDEALKRRRDLFQKRWGGFWKCSRCGSTRTTQDADSLGIGCHTRDCYGNATMIRTGYSDTRPK